MIIPPYPQSGFPVDASWGRYVVDCLRALRIRSGRGIRTQEGSDGTLVESLAQTSMNAGAVMGFSGKAYIAGNETTGLNSDSSKPFVRCFLDTATAEEHAGPMPKPWPPNESWREKAYTSGHIVIDRA